MCRSTGLKMSKETLLRCKVDDQIRLFDSAGSKILKLLTQDDSQQRNVVAIVDSPTQFCLKSIIIINSQQGLQY